MNDTETTPESTDFDYEVYENSLQNRLKQAWIVLQVCIQTYYMVRGVRAYSSIRPYWTKRKTLFVFQTVAIVYLLVNEFTGRSIVGFYLILIFSQYSLFLVFSIVVDSCFTTANREGTSKLHYANKIYRAGMHIATWTLFALSFTIKPCDVHVYPLIFIGVVAIILTHQIFDLVMYKYDYMIDWNDLPPISPDKLDFNQELTKKQLSMLFKLNLLFGTISMATVAIGVFIINDPNKFDNGQAHIFCANGYEWINNDVWGMLFITLHQMLILLQINMSQYVMVRIPLNMGLFEKDQKHTFSMGLRHQFTGLLKKEDNPNMEPLLSKLEESKTVKQDNFRI